MKEKILMLVIGALIGAIITTGVFLVINKNNSTQNGRLDMSQMENFNRDEARQNEGRGQKQKMMDGNTTTENSTTQDDQTPPEMPNNQNGDRPSMPNGEQPNGNKMQGMPNAPSNSNA